MTPELLYTIFRYKHGAYISRPRKLPKDITKHINEKMNSVQSDNLKTAAIFFDSKWINIDPNEYINCGFDVLGKKFSFHNFFDPRIMRLYIMRDKNKKRELETSKQDLINSAKFILEYIKENNISFLTYINKKIGHRRIIIEHYISNKICPLFFCFLLYNNKIELTEEENAILPYISVQYRNATVLIKKIDDFLMKIEDKLYGFNPIR